MTARARWVIVAAVVAVLAVGVGVVVFVVGGDDGPSGEAAAADAYFAAWAAEEVDAMAALIENPPGDFADQFERFDVGSVSFERTGSRKPSSGEAEVSFRASVDVAGLGPWTYEGMVPLRHVEDRWLVQWSPAVVHPQLVAGDTLARSRTMPERAPILGAGDDPLATAVPVVTIGIVPQRMTDQAQVEQVLQEHLGVDPAVVKTELGRPGVQPDWFLPIITVPRARYDALKPIIYDIKGLSFPDGLGRGTLPAGLATAVLGRTGEITAELLEQLGSPYQVGDVVGLTGLERVFERQLAGSPQGDVHIEDAAGVLKGVLMTFAGEAPVPVRTTLSRPVQEAAEAALAGVTGPAAIVAVDDAGHVVAAATRPEGDDFNRAFAGAYPPGSTFKMVTGAALLESGLDASSPMSCPPTLNVDGRDFRNFEGEAATGSISFAEAMAISCNTAFIDAASKLPDGAVAAAAEQFGFNVAYDLGLDTAGGAFPIPESATERAAAAIGQGRVTASVVHMASVAAAVASGTWRSPVVLADRLAQQESRPLPAGVAPVLTDMMRGVVATGTGTAAAVPGRDIAGKTGTAEFGTETPPQTHAWFAAFEGNIGVAILLEGGGVGGRDAAPLANTFFTALP